MQEDIDFKSRQLTQTSDKLDKLLKQMDDHGSKLTDSTPLQEIKKSIFDLKKELISNDIILHVYRQGYLNQSLHAQ